MSYDLAVWEGDRPATDDDALREFEQLYDELMGSDQPIPPTARIQRYVDDLVTRWPDITTEAGDDSPWAHRPLIGNASGPMIYFAMTTSSGPEVGDEVAHNAAAVGGLVCFDPQTGTLR
jgi:hypothetical protein